MILKVLKESFLSLVLHFIKPSSHFPGERRGGRLGSYPICCFVIFC